VKKTRLSKSLLITGQWQDERKTTVSFAINHINVKLNIFDVLFSRTDQALYQTKALRRDLVFFRRATTLHSLR